MKDIAVNQMKTSTSSGFIINYFIPGQVPQDDESEKLGAHRDDFYMFFLIESGEAAMMVDLQELLLQQSSVFYVLPGQIHRRFSTQDSAKGWFVAIETPMVPPDYRNVFESQLLLQKPLPLSSRLFGQCSHLLKLMAERAQEDVNSPFQLPVMHSLLQSFLGIVAGSFSHVNDQVPHLSRQVQISQQLKMLLVNNILTVKSPSAYAEMMHISESYLNEVLKKNTGFSVSYWIQHQVVLEAKRLLYYTPMNVKEIAHHLGYEDSAYFSRIFKNFTGTTPQTFRTQNRK